MSGREAVAMMPSIRRMSDPSPLRASPNDFPCTDVGNAARFAAYHHDLVRYSANVGWLTWDTARWSRDETGEVQRLARQTVRAIYSEAGAADDRNRRAELAAWAKASDSRRGIDNMLALAKSELGIACRDSIFDRDPYKINTFSGIVDLRTADFLPHDPEQNFTKLAPVFYRPQALCPRWCAFIDRIMDGDHDRMAFLQRAFGYSLTGDTSEQVMFVLYGRGANGKTTLLEVMRTILGDYAMHTPAETLMVKSGAGITNDVARLRGARFVSAVEADQGRRLAEPLIKQMTGMDTLTARFLYHESFEFRPSFKVWLATNHKPVIRGTDHAIWRRIRLVPFDVTIPDAERDRTLVEKLLAESPGILWWAVQGYLAWRENGLGSCEAVTAATAEYRAEMDPLTDFIAEECVVSEGLHGYGLHEAYERWCSKGGQKDVLNARDFKGRMEARGFVHGRDSRRRFFSGIGLVARESES